MEFKRDPRFGRMIPAMVTPFNDDLELDLDRAQDWPPTLRGGNDAAHRQRNHRRESHGVLPQKISFSAPSSRAVTASTPVIANVGDNCTADTVVLRQGRRETRRRRLHVRRPYYNKPPQEGMYQPLQDHCGCGGAPHHPLQHPGPLRCQHGSETTLRLANDCENVIAVKEASGKTTIRSQPSPPPLPSGFTCIPATTPPTYDIMRLGGAGVISTTGNVAPERMKALVEVAAKGKWDEARAAHEALLPLMNGLFETSNPILVKEALKPCRLPRRRRAPAARRRHRRAIGTPRIDHARGRRP